MINDQKNNAYFYVYRFKERWEKIGNDLSVFHIFSTSIYFLLDWKLVFKLIP